MPSPLPNCCPQCGRSRWSLSNAEQATWEAQTEQLCPPCLRGWYRVAPCPVGTRCAGCGRRTTALTAGVCSRCAETGISAPSLFDALTVTPPAQDETP